MPINLPMQNRPTISNLPSVDTSSARTEQGSVSVPIGTSVSAQPPPTPSAAAAPLTPSASAPPTPSAPAAPPTPSAQSPAAPTPSAPAPPTPSAPAPPTPSAPAETEASSKIVQYSPERREMVLQVYMEVCSTRPEFISGDKSGRKNLKEAGWNYFVQVNNVDNDFLTIQVWRSRHRSIPAADDASFASSASSQWRQMKNHLKSYCFFHFYQYIKTGNPGPKPEHKTWLQWFQEHYADEKSMFFIFSSLYLQQ